MVFGLQAVFGAGFSLLAGFLKLFRFILFMRLLLEDMISEVKLLLAETKGIRSRVLLKDALKALDELAIEKERKR